MNTYINIFIYIYVYCFYVVGWKQKQLKTKTSAIYRSQNTIRSGGVQGGPGGSRRGPGEVWRGLVNPKVSQICFFIDSLPHLGPLGGSPEELLGKYFHVFANFFEASMRHACWDRLFIDFWSLKACKIEGLSRRKSLICLEKIEGFIRIMIFLRRCVKTRCQVAMRAVLGRFKRPPGDGFGNEIDFQSLFLTNKIY